MNRFAYSALIAFISSILTLVVVVWVAPLSLAAEGDSERVVSQEELARHDSADSCWKAIEGRVYDVTDFIDRHPTPESVMTEWCGRESTEAWNDKGNGRPHSDAADAMLDAYLVGRLEGARVTERPASEATETRPAVTGGDPGVYRDGSYYAESEPSERGTLGIIEITVHDGRIVGVYYDEISRDDSGAVTYRKSADLNYAQRWRRVSGGVTQLSTYPAYERMLVASGTVDGVDAITGATGVYEGFVQLAQEALAQAREDSSEP